jgi:TolB protein
MSTVEKEMHVQRKVRPGRRLPLLAALAALACLLAAWPASPQGTGGDVIRLGVERRSVPRLRVKLLPLEVAASAPGAAEAARAMAGRLARDLHYSGLIEMSLPLPPGVPSPYANGRPPQGEAGGMEYGISLRLETAPGTGLVWVARLLEPDGGIRVSKRYTVELPDFARSVHHFADEVVLQLTGEQGIAQTRILFSRGKGDKREVYVVDFDGENLRQVTRNGSLNLTPRW